MNTEKKYKSIDAERFIDACQVLIDKGIARSFKEIAEKSGYSSQDFTDIKSGKKDLQRKFLEEVSRNYPINEVFVLTGTGQEIKLHRSIAEQLPPDDLIKEIQSSNHSQDFKEKEIEMWKELYRMQAELMDEIKKDRDRLQRLVDEKNK